MKVQEDSDEKVEPETEEPAWKAGGNLREDHWYYCKEEGKLYLGWIKLKSKWYYLDGENADIMACNEVKEIGDKYYAFDADGVMYTGWIQRPEGWYYADASGAQMQGWQRISNAWYYLDAADEEHPGLMVSDCSKEIAGHTYFFNASGAMREGWYHDGSDWYYYDPSGLIASGWRAVKGYWYYLDPENDNKMTGAVWKVIKDHWYYFKYSGAMARNTVIDGYVVHNNGAYIRSQNKLGWQNPAGYPQVSSLTVKLPPYCTGYFTYVTPSRISIYASRQDCINAFIARAYEYRGTRFVEPWSSYPGDAVDCSGFVLQCLYATGMDLGVYNPYNHRWLPSQTYNSMNWYHNNTFMPVSVNSIQRGDLVYYRGHVAIYLGNGQIIDSWPGQGVLVRPIGSRGAVIGAARPYV